MNMRRFFVFGLFLLSTAAVHGEPVWVGRFAGSGGLPAGWQIEHLNTKFPATAYRQRLWDGVPAVEGGRFTGALNGKLLRRRGSARP